MIDYYPYLLRGVQEADPYDELARRAVYVRAWQLVTEQLRAQRPPISAEELRTHRSAIQTAIERIERQYAPPVIETPPRRPLHVSRPATVAWGVAAPEDYAPPAAQRSRRGLWAAAIATVIVAVLGGGGYATWTVLTKKPVSIARSIEAAKQEPLLRRRSVVPASTNDLPPGVDGGSTDADLSLIFRRQRVFYRTTLPPGTIVVDKLQHFAYLVMPNSSALRYGVGVGSSCAELSGLRRIASKAEWPEWKPPPGSGLNRGAPMPGGPGNPLGARVLQLDDEQSRIHGTNAPKTIGEDVTLGCVRLVNDDVADLYNRVSLGAGVVLR
jgi:lipoprotein-anchoring transpeptidase ErfK/SrfK